LNCPLAKDLYAVFSKIRQRIIAGLLNTKSNQGADQGLLHFADASLDALNADVFWHTDDCTDVLPMTFCAAESVATGVALDLRQLSCRTAFSSDQDVPASRYSV
jgi:hypothetical protein